jgi:hypothetical protein
MEQEFAARIPIYEPARLTNRISAIAKLESAISNTIFTKEGGTKCSMN